MASNTAEIQTINQPDLKAPSPDEFQHSEGAYTPPEVTERRIVRLKSIVQNNRKPYRVLDLGAYRPDEAVLKSLDQIAVETEARKISTNRSHSLDTVNFYCSVTPERITRINSGVEGAPVRGNSAHGVMFLKLGTQRGRLLDVAVKTFDREPSKAFREFVNTFEVARRGINTLNPIAVIIDGGQQNNEQPLGYYFSEMEPIRPMDRLRVLRAGYVNLKINGERSQDYLEYIARTGEILAEMHLQGIYPADPQIKNFAIKQNGEVIPMDFESTDIYSQDFMVINPDKFVRESARGLKVLFSSLAGRNLSSIPFFAGISGETLCHAFNDTIFSHYKRVFEDTVLNMVENKVITPDQFAKSMESLSRITEDVNQHIMHPPVSVIH